MTSEKSVDPKTVGEYLETLADLMIKRVRDDKPASEEYPIGTVITSEVTGKQYTLIADEAADQCPMCDAFPNDPDVCAQVKCNGDNPCRALIIEGS